MKTTETKQKARKVLCYHCQAEIEWVNVIQPGDRPGRSPAADDFQRFNLDGTRHKCSGDRG